MSRVAIRNVILILLLLIILVGLFLVLRPSSTRDSSTTSESTSSAPPEKTFDLAIQNGTMTPAEISVNEGDHVDFRITSDRPLGFHLHGYDLEQEVEADESAELSFDATITGRFAIEDHDTDTELGTLLVQPR